MRVQYLLVVMRAQLVWRQVRFGAVVSEERATLLALKISTHLKIVY